MPSIREHQPSHSHSSGDHSPTKSDKSLLADKDRNIRGKSSPSIITRVPRVGVTNFINVIKSLHQDESINYFPVTKETLQEYIDSERKDLIKAGSLDQYLQHIQAYNNIALGFGWDEQVFCPIIKKALDELRNYEDETSSMIESISSQPQPTLVNSAISQQSNNFSNYLIPNFYSIPDDVEMEDLFTIDKASFLNHLCGIINPQPISSYQTPLISLPVYLINHQEIVYYDNRGNTFSFEPIEGLQVARIVFMLRLWKNQAL
ncbi:7486_t:CDS:2 [Funneliformis caledonium]|uniref:7486_t:CDS:1 n=1 Tax=Funneliformis caledonium TaxID=1117310 RepID=A0A9N8VE52_9GLOM|nr:7486_t:CDS:2 [Funneliformis caledonium]